MTTVKIISHTYEKRIQFQKLDEKFGEWQEITYQSNSHSQLISEFLKQSFLTFKAKEILTYIIDEYDDGGDLILVFQGPNDEFLELKYLVEDIQDSLSINLHYSELRLANASDILPRVVEIFDKTIELLPETLENDYEIQQFRESSSDIIPLVVIGNYSVGKSTFINALLGQEVLPNSVNPETAKVVDIRRSSDETSSIEFEIGDQSVCLKISDDLYDVVEGADVLNESYPSLLNLVKNGEKIDSQTVVHDILEAINKFPAITDEESISDIIRVKLSSQKGLLAAESHHRFAIFDTPGSNASSHAEHLEVLRKAMKNMSNGLVIVVTEYKSLDSTDNANLQQELSSIEGIDTRFTLIVVNRADEADFTDYQREKILQLNLPKQLFSEGIYFVSSIMGLGQKTNGVFREQNYERIFKKSLDEFSNPQSDYYQELYRYNIVPDQLTLRKLNESEQVEDLLFSNSGFFNLETEIDNFARNYSPYNKCQQAKHYLERMIKKTEVEISRLKSDLEHRVAIMENELHNQKNQLIHNSKNQYYNAFTTVSTNYQANLLSSSQSLPSDLPYVTLIELCDSYYEDARIKFNLSQYRAEKENSQQKLKHKLSSLGHNVKNVFNKEGIELLKTDLTKLRDGATDTWEDFAIYREQKNKAYASVSLSLKVYAQDNYNQRLINAKENLYHQSIAFWESQCQYLKSVLSEFIGAAEELPIETREDIRLLILNFEEILLEEPKDLFHQVKVSQGFDLGKFHIGNSNKIDLKKLSTIFEKNFRREVNQILTDLQNRHQSAVQDWSDKLLSLVIENIVEFNPDLRRTNTHLLNDKAQIENYESRLEQLVNYSQEIQDLMSFKEVSK